MQPPAPQRRDLIATYSLGGQTKCPRNKLSLGTETPAVNMPRIDHRCRFWTTLAGSLHLVAVSIQIKRPPNVVLSQDCLVIGNAPKVRSETSFRMVNRE